MTIDRPNIPYECSGGRRAHLPGVELEGRKCPPLVYRYCLSFVMTPKEDATLRGWGGASPALCLLLSERLEAVCILDEQ